MNFANGATAIAVPTAFIVPLSTDFGWTRLQIAVVTSFGAIIGILIAPFTGRTFDVTQSYHSTFVPILQQSRAGTVLRGLTQPPKHARMISCAGNSLPP